jgi:OTU domain-containing protein 6
MFAAISHQLAERHGVALNVRDLRAMASDHIAGFGEKYKGFLDLGDEADGDEDGAVEKYCKKLRDTTMWGGHVELDALSEALKTPIQVYQVDGDPLEFGSQFAPKPALKLWYTIQNEN